MVELRVTLPDWANDFIQEQVAGGRFQSADEVLAELIDRARSVRADDRLAEMILAGENSGEGVRFTDEWWEKRMSELRSEAARRRSA